LPFSLSQHRNVDSSSAVSSQALSYVSNVTLGDLLICVVRGTDTLTGITITDSQGNSWTNCTFNAIGALASLQISYAIAGSTGANTVTATPNASSTIRMAIYEYAGNLSASPLDAENNVQTGNGTAAASNSITPANGNSLVIAAAAVTATSSFAAGTNFTLEDNVPAGSAGKLGVEDWIQTAATATTGPLTVNSTQDWMAAIAVFKPAGAGGSTSSFFDLCPGAGGAGMQPGNVVVN
jgi:hypothetical protein